MLSPNIIYALLSLSAVCIICFIVLPKVFFTLTAISLTPIVFNKIVLLDIGYDTKILLLIAAYLFILFGFYLKGVLIDGKVIRYTTEG